MKIKKRDFTRYIIISGEIENNDEINKFPMSLNFLNSLDIDTMYQIKIDIVEDSINCYIKSQQELPAFVKELGDNVEPIVVETQEETSITDSNH